MQGLGSRMSAVYMAERELPIQKRAINRGRSAYERNNESCISEKLPHIPLEDCLIAAPRPRDILRLQLLEQIDYIQGGIRLPESPQRDGGATVMYSYLEHVRRDAAGSQKLVVRHEH